MTEAKLFVDCRAALAEGPFWHPLRNELFWFDILGKTLTSASADGQVTGGWTFDGCASAAAVIDQDTLAVMTEHGIFRLDLETNMQNRLAEVEPNTPGNRSNDCRVHPSGAWWVSTMSKAGDEDQGAGAVYHFHRGRVSKLIGDVTIPNSICFSADGGTAYVTDTPTKRILRAPVNPSNGLLAGDWDLFTEVTDGRGSPDGSVVDSAGYLWNARYNGHCVVRYAPDGIIDRIVDVPVGRVTCPAFGGPDLKTLFITTARESAPADELAEEPALGSIFSIEVDVPGQRDPLLAA